MVRLEIDISNCNTDMASFGRYAYPENTLLTYQLDVLVCNATLGIALGIGLEILVHGR